MSFSPEELERYARHIILREIGGPGQQKLKAAHVAVIGAGGLGSPALMYLAAAGIGRIRLIEDDVVSLSNLQRQVLHATDRVGRTKADSARMALAAINPHVVLDTRETRLDPANARDLLAGVDLVLDGSDSFATRATVNAACAALGIPLISGAIAQWEGQVSLFDPARGTPCYACVFPDPPAPGQAPSCAEAGVMGALAGIIGAMMAGEAIKHLTGAGHTLRGEMLIHDALWSESRKIRLNRRADCPVCDSAGGGA
ncbi:HesA/MoeB/ThiF family protein [Halovulum dunhuangense]|uniref:Molybdopterin-synthase adenylyltransferase n=1 Tax=Halovulum dunhuangense TaxID=1505036 RepID=A0A849KPY3_9RHOB|nr:HesA/MoeB/ThiF family protein [Halovulum dunhuangense]